MTSWRALGMEQAGCARPLGISRKALWEKRQRLGIPHTRV
jgi:DNA-binding NtrC family response regulator